MERGLSRSLPYLPRYHSLSPARTPCLEGRGFASLRSLSSSSPRQRLCYINGGEPAKLTTTSYRNRCSPSPRRSYKVHLFGPAVGADGRRRVHHATRVTRSVSAHDLQASHVYTSQDDLLSRDDLEADARRGCSSLQDLVHSGPFFPDATAASESGLSLGGLSDDSLDNLSQHSFGSSSAFHEMTFDSEPERGDMSDAYFSGTEGNYSGSQHSGDRLLDVLYEDDPDGKNPGMRRTRSKQNPLSPLSYGDHRRRELQSPQHSDPDSKVPVKLQALRVLIPSSDLVVRSAVAGIKNQKDQKGQGSPGEKKTLSSTPLAQSTPHESPRGPGDARLSVLACWNADADDSMEERARGPAQRIARALFDADWSSCNSSQSEDNFSDIPSATPASLGARKTRLAKRAMPRPDSTKPATSRGHEHDAPSAWAETMEQTPRSKPASGRLKDSGGGCPEWHSGESDSNGEGGSPVCGGVGPETSLGPEVAGKLNMVTMVTIPLISAGKHGQEKLRKRPSQSSPPATPAVSPPLSPRQQVETPPLTARGLGSNTRGELADQCVKDSRDGQKGQCLNKDTEKAKTNSRDTIQVSSPPTQNYSVLGVLNNEGDNKKAQYHDDRSKTLREKRTSAGDVNCRSDSTTAGDVNCRSDSTTVGDVNCRPDSTTAGDVNCRSDSTTAGDVNCRSDSTTAGDVNCRSDSTTAGDVNCRSDSTTAGDVNCRSDSTTVGDVNCRSDSTTAGDVNCRSDSTTAGDVNCRSDSTTAGDVNCRSDSTTAGDVNCRSDSTTAGDVNCRSDSTTAGDVNCRSDSTTAGDVNCRSDSTTGDPASRAVKASHSYDRYAGPGEVTGIPTASAGQFACSEGQAEDARAAVVNTTRSGVREGRAEEGARHTSPYLSPALSPDRAGDRGEEGKLGSLEAGARSTSSSTWPSLAPLTPKLSSAGSRAVGRASEHSHLESVPAAPVLDGKSSAAYFSSTTTSNPSDYSIKTTTTDPSDYSTKTTTTDPSDYSTKTTTTDVDRAEQNEEEKEKAMFFHSLSGAERSTGEARSGMESSRIDPAFVAAARAASEREIPHRLVRVVATAQNTTDRETVQQAQHQDQRRQLSVTTEFPSQWPRAVFPSSGYCETYVNSSCVSGVPQLHLYQTSPCGGGDVTDLSDNRSTIDPVLSNNKDCSSSSQREQEVNWYMSGGLIGEQLTSGHPFSRNKPLHSSDSKGSVSAIGSSLATDSKGSVSASGSSLATDSKGSVSASGSSLATDRKGSVSASGSSLATEPGEEQVAQKTQVVTEVCHTVVRKTHSTTVSSEREQGSRCEGSLSNLHDKDNAEDTTKDTTSKTTIVEDVEDTVTTKTTTTTTTLNHGDDVGRESVKVERHKVGGVSCDTSAHHCDDLIDTRVNCLYQQRGGLSTGDRLGSPAAPDNQLNHVMREVKPDWEGHPDPGVTAWNACPSPLKPRDGDGGHSDDSAEMCPAKRCGEHSQHTATTATTATSATCDSRLDNLQATLAQISGLEQAKIGAWSSDSEATHSPYQDHAEATSVLRQIVRGDTAGFPHLPNFSNFPAQAGSSGDYDTIPETSATDRPTFYSYSIQVREAPTGDTYTPAGAHFHNGAVGLGREAYDNDYDNAPSVTTALPSRHHQQQHLQLLKPGQLKASSLWTLQEETESLLDAVSPKPSRRALASTASDDEDDASINGQDTVIETHHSSPKVGGSNPSLCSVEQDLSDTAIGHKHCVSESSDFDESDGNYSSISTVESASCRSSGYSREQTPMSDEAEAGPTWKGLTATNLDGVSTFSDFVSGLEESLTGSSCGRGNLKRRREQGQQAFTLDGLSECLRQFSPQRAGQESFPGADNSCLHHTPGEGSHPPFQPVAHQNIFYFAHHKHSQPYHDSHVSNETSMSMSNHGASGWVPAPQSDGLSETSFRLDLSRISPCGSPAPSDLSDASSAYTCTGTAQIKRRQHVSFDEAPGAPLSPPRRAGFDTPVHTSTPKAQPALSTRRPPRHGPQRDEKLLRDSASQFDLILSDLDRRTRPAEATGDMRIVESNSTILADKSHSSNVSNYTDLYKAFTNDDAEKKQNNTCIVLEDENMSSYRFKRYLKKSHTRRKKGKKVIRFLSRLSCVSEGMSSPDMSPVNKKFKTDSLDERKAGVQLFTTESGQPILASSSSFQQLEAPVGVFSSSSPQASPASSSGRSRADSAYSSISETVSQSSVSSPRPALPALPPYRTASSSFLSPQQHGTPAQTRSAGGADRSWSRDSAFSLSEADRTLAPLDSSKDLSGEEDMLTALSDVFEQLDVCEGEIDKALLDRLGYGHHRVATTRV
ncbi:hypothetical protein EGW08_021343, partial [Elysia chlorotica]